MATIEPNILDLLRDDPIFRSLILDENRPRRPRRWWHFWRPHRSSLITHR